MTKQVIKTLPLHLALMTLEDFGIAAREVRVGSQAILLNTRNNEIVALRLGRGYSFPALMTYCHTLNDANRVTLVAM